MKRKTVFESLAEDYPLICLDPDTDTRETYRRVVLRGEEPENKSLGHYRGDRHDRDETADTPAGPVRVITLGDRHDFELVLRGLMAARSGPTAPIPKSQGAAMVTVFNWKRINAHLARFPQEERADEFKRFTAVKANFTDMLVVLSRGPYSGAGAAEIGLNEEEWLAFSDTIRRCHELTHVICRRMYPDDTEAIRDELIADAVGLYAAFGRFEPEKEKLFLGVWDGRYTGGRLENYTDEPEKLAPRIGDMLDRIGEIVNTHAGVEPFALIPALMSAEYDYSR